jgi:hypothetical protein
MSLVRNPRYSLNRRGGWPLWSKPEIVPLNRPQHNLRLRYTVIVWYRVMKDTTFIYSEGSYVIAFLNAVIV